uniref:C-type lectin domain-containing protein n=1 Tax=Loa loa TaxID=7209 RepID=A0A1I7VXN9_LOALO
MNTETYYWVQVIVRETNGGSKLGPCPEKWLPLIPTNNYALLEKCIAHVNVTLLQSKVTEVNGAINACSHVFGNESTIATIFRPNNKRELKNFLTYASEEALEGMIDIFVEGSAPYDHFGNDLRQLGDAVLNPLSTALDKQCAWNLQKYRTTARNARDVCKEKKAELVTISNIGEWSYVTRLANTLAPNTRDRSLLLGYTRCSTDPPEWRTMEGGISSGIFPFPNATTANDAECCLEMNIEHKINCKEYFYR